MKCIRIDSSSDVKAPLAVRLLRELESEDVKRVLWIVAGGSNIAMTVEVMQQLPDELTPKLAIALSDERFGPVGHPDSNLQQLFNAGFQPKQASVIPVLTPGLPLKETCERYSSAMQAAFGAADVTIAQLGIGSDGHIAGVLPGTAGVNSKELVVGYETETYTRITLTLKALKKVTAAFAFAFGADKHETLEKLCNKDLPLAKQPAQILQRIHESYVYNDQVGGEL